MVELFVFISWPLCVSFIELNTITCICGVLLPNLNGCRCNTWWIITVYTLDRTVTREINILLFDYTELVN